MCLIPVGERNRYEHHNRYYVHEDYADSRQRQESYMEFSVIYILQFFREGPYVVLFSSSSCSL